MTLDKKLEIVTIIVQAAVFGLVIFRSIYKKLPLFSSYLAWLLLITCSSLFVSSNTSAAYQRAYLIASIIDTAFMFSVLVELSMSVLSPIRSSLSQWTLFVVGGVLALVFVAIWPFTMPPGLSNLTSTSQYFIHLDVASSVLRIVFFLALAGFSQLLSIGWRDRELQIATGLGFFSFVSLSVTVLHMNQGTGTADLLRQYHVLDEVVTGSYIVSMLYWIASFAQKVPERREFTPQMQNFLLAVAGNARSTRMAMASPSEFNKRKDSD